MMLELFHNVRSEDSAWVYVMRFFQLGMLTCFLIIMIVQTIQDYRRGYVNTYRRGQIDALKGIIKYKLEKNEDGEEVWTKIEDPKK